MDSNLGSAGSSGLIPTSLKCKPCSLVTTKTARKTERALRVGSSPTKNPYSPLEIIMMIYLMDSSCISIKIMGIRKECKRTVKERDLDSSSGHLGINILVIGLKAKGKDMENTCRNQGINTKADG